MKILFLGYAISTESLEWYIKKYKFTPKTFPQQYFDYEVAKGISKNGVRIKCLTLPPVPSFPNCGNIFVGGREETIEVDGNVLEIKIVPVINVIGIKHVFLILYLIYHLLFTYGNGIKDYKILINWPISSLMFIALLLKKIYKSSISLIIPDFPEHFYKDEEGNIFKRLIKKTDERLISNFDKYILLSEFMKNKINLKNTQSYLLMEGTINPLLFEEYRCEEQSIIKLEIPEIKLMYAGALTKTSGVMEVVEALKRVNNINVHFSIYGDGDIIDQLEKEIADSNNIIYYGTKSRKYILMEELKSDFLICPRDTGEEYTMYSFPSKILEYMLSGTPVISTKLKGIPKEYDEYLYWIDTKAKNFHEELNEILSIPYSERHKKGYAAQRFVKSKKTDIKQGKKIVEYIN